MSTYLWINILTIIFPLILSFDRKVHYFRRWDALFPAIFLVGAAFVAWDVYFTRVGIWGFNSLHLSGLYMAGLPVEEWLFFLCVPYAIVFIFDCLRYYFPEQPLKRGSRFISLLLIVVFMLVGLANTGKLYTLTTFVSLAVSLAVIHFFFRFAYMGYFYVCFLIVLLPFLLVNGILTGSFIQEEVVWYNEAHNMGIRIFSIPLEDTFYGMLLLLLNVFFYMRFLGKSRRHTAQENKIVEAKIEP